MRIFLVFVTCLLVSNTSFGQKFIERNTLIDVPGMHIIPKNSFIFILRMNPGGEALLRAKMTPLERLSFGMSVGADSIIGYGTPGFLWDVDIKYKTGGKAISFALGFDSQEYIGIRRGFYALVGWNLGDKFFPCIGNSYLTEFVPFGGLEFAWSSRASFIVDCSLIEEKWYLNAGMRWSLAEIAEGLQLEFDFRDFLKNIDINRIMKISYVSSF